MTESTELLYSPRETSSRQNIKHYLLNPLPTDKKYSFYSS